MYRQRYPATYKKNIRAALNLVEVNITEASSRFNRISNQPANKQYLHKNHSFQLKNIVKLKIAKPTNRQKHELKQSHILKLQSLNLPKSVIGK